MKEIIPTEEHLIGPDALEYLLDAIDLTGLDNNEIAQAFDGFFSRCDRSIQTLLYATLANVLGVDAHY